MDLTTKRLKIAFYQMELGKMLNMVDLIAYASDGTIKTMDQYTDDDADKMLHIFDQFRSTMDAIDYSFMTNNKED